MKTRILSSLHRAALLLAAFAFATAARAGTFSTAAWTGDASTGIASGQTVWAYHFGSTTTATVNGISVPGLPGPTASNANFDLTGTSQVFNNDTNNVTGPGSALIAPHFVWGGNPATVTVKGLTAGATYTVSFLSVGWQDDPDADFRALTFSSGSDSALVKPGQFGADNGLRVDYTFTATGSTRAIAIAVANGNGATFHLYGLALNTVIAPLTVTHTLDSGPGSLRWAVANAADIAGANSVVFSGALAGQTLTLSSQILINDATGLVTLDATTLPGGVTISGGGTSRLFSVGSGKSLALAGLTLTGGNGSGGNGGALLNNGTTTLDRCTVSGSVAGSGGGIFNESGAMTLSRCTLSGNDTGPEGGGGAIVNAATMTLTQCTLSGNHASSRGAGILNLSSTLTLTHCTLSGNSGRNGSGIYNLSGAVTLTNGIVSGNSATNTGPDLYNDASNGPATITRVGANLIGSLINVSGGTSSGPAANPAAPLLAPLASNGGHTQTRALMSGSPAIDASSGSAITTDQRRFLLAGTADVGAFEFNGGDPILVTSTNDSGAGSLRQALANAAALPGGDIVPFAPGFTGPIVLSSEIVITDTSGGVTIDAGSLPAGVTIDGGPGTNRIFTVSSGTSLALLGLTLTGGNGGGAAQNGNGNAIVNFGTLALTRCTLSGNTRISGSGGAILNDGGALSLTQCTLSANSTTNGGAIFQTTGTLTLTQCTLSGNQAGNDGGAIYNQTGALTLTQCTLSGNTTDSEGGAIYTQSGALTLTHCTLSGNQASSSGGAIFNQSGTPALNNSIVAGNTTEVGGQDISTSVTILTLGVNFVGNPANSGLTASATILTTAVNGSVNPAPLGHYGGPTQTMALLSGSPAVDAVTAGNEAPGLTTDQRGLPRNLDGNHHGTAAPVIGAFELNRAIVTTVADELTTPSSGGAGISLREALRDGADLILMAFELSTQSIVLGSQLEVAKYVVIDAASSGGMVVSGNNAGRVFRIAPGVSASFLRHTLTGGQVSGGFPASYGGGVFVEGALTLTECSLAGNSAFVGGGAYVANNGAASLTLERCTVSGNTASFGGGIQNEGTLVCNGSTFAENAASQDGGAISAPFDKPVTLKHCTLSLNTAATGGGTIGTGFAVENSIISGNTAPSGPDVSGAPVFTGAFIVGSNALLAPLGEYGGPTKTMALRPGSLARDFSPNFVPATDQRGFPIVGVPDCGAYEAGTLGTNYLAYIWETLPTAGNGMTTDPLHAATFDFDGDGVTNGNEDLALTHAADPDSYLRILTITRSGNLVNLTFPTVVGRNYTFEDTDELSLTTIWEPIPGSFPGNGSVRGFAIGPYTGFDRLFFRIRVGP